MSTELESLQSTVELLTLKCEDLVDNNISLSHQLKSKYIEIESLKSDLENLIYVQRRGVELQINNNVLEGNIIQLKKELATLNDNYSHAKDHVKKQDSFIQECRTVINSLRDKCQKSDENKSMAEHLAQKSILLKQENDKLSAVNDNYQKVVATHLTKASKYSCVEYGSATDKNTCGTCLECKLKSLEQEYNKLSTQNSNYHQTIIDILSLLTDTLDAGIFRRRAMIAHLIEFTKQKS